MWAFDSFSLAICKKCSRWHSGTSVLSHSKSISPNQPSPVSRRHKPTPCSNSSHLLVMARRFTILLPSLQPISSLLLTSRMPKPDSVPLLFFIPFCQVIESRIAWVEGHHYFAGGAVALFRDDQLRLLHLVFATDAALLLVCFFAL